MANTKTRPFRRPTVLAVQPDGTIGPESPDQRAARLAAGRRAARPNPTMDTWERREQGWRAPGTSWGDDHDDR